MEVSIVVGRDILTISAPNRMYAVPITGLGDAIAKMPVIAEQLVAAGVTRVKLDGPATAGQLPASVWVLLVPKGNQRLEELRLEALRKLDEAGVEVVAEVQVVSADGLSAALGAGVFGD